jgi:anti-sigma B factor antagonist
VFEFHVSSRPLGDDAWVVWLVGEVDMHVAPELAAELHSLADAGAREIVVHLGGIELIDSTALGVLLRARDAIKRTGGEIVLVTSDRRVRRLFEVTGLDRTFRIESSLPEAVQVAGEEVPA